MTQTTPFSTIGHASRIANALAQSLAVRYPAISTQSVFELLADAHGFGSVSGMVADIESKERVLMEKPSSPKVARIATYGGGSEESTLRYVQIPLDVAFFDTIARSAIAAKYAPSGVVSFTYEVDYWDRVESQAIEQTRLFVDSAGCFWFEVTLNWGSVVPTITLNASTLNAAVAAASQSAVTLHREDGLSPR